MAFGYFIDLIESGKLKEVTKFLSDRKLDSFLHDEGIAITAIYYDQWEMGNYFLEQVKAKVSEKTFNDIKLKLLLTAAWRGHKDITEKMLNMEMDYSDIHSPHLKVSYWIKHSADYVEQKIHNIKPIEALKHLLLLNIPISEELIEKLYSVGISMVDGADGILLAADYLGEEKIWEKEGESLELILGAIIEFSEGQEGRE